MAQDPRFPFALRPIGFSHDEAMVLDSLLVGQQLGKYRYSCLHKDNLQDPDLYLVNASEAEALEVLSHLNPSDVRPALLIGSAAAQSRHAHIARPIRLFELLAALDALIDKRVAALARLQASDLVAVPERRRNRVASTSSDPSLFARLRRPPIEGGIVVVDKNAELADYLVELLARRNLSVSWTDTEQSAVTRCWQQPTALVIINTSTSGIDPYRLCEMIKTGSGNRTRVIFLVGGSFEYDPEKAYRVNCDGFLSKPVAVRQLASTLKTFLP